MKIGKRAAKAIRKSSEWSLSGNEHGTTLRVSEGGFSWDRGPETQIDGEQKCRGSFWFNGYSDGGGWGAIKALIKEGDRLEWRAVDNGNQYTKLAEIKSDSWEDLGDRCLHPDYKGLHVDTLYVTLIRERKDGREVSIVHDLLVQVIVCPDNSARAIKEGAA